MIVLAILAIVLVFGGAAYTWIKGNKEDPW